MVEAIDTCPMYIESFGELGLYVTTLLVPAAKRRHGKSVAKVVYTWHARASSRCLAAGRLASRLAQSFSGVARAQGTAEQHHVVLGDGERTTVPDTQVGAQLSDGARGKRYPPGLVELESPMRRMPVSASTSSIRSRAASPPAKARRIDRARWRYGGRHMAGRRPARDGRPSMKSSSRDLVSLDRSG